MLTGNVPEERIKSFAVAKIDESGRLARIIEKPDEATLAVSAAPALAEHELLAVWAVDLQGVPGDQAVAPRRVRDPRRGAIRHQRPRRAVCRREDSRAGARHDLPRRHRLGGGDPGRNQGEPMIELSFPGDLTDADELATQLFTTGLSRDACESKARLFARAAAALSVTGEAGSGRPPLAFFVPGRIEVLGKHTDYAGGRTMVAAVERGFCIAALPRDDRQIDRHRRGQRRDDRFRRRSRLEAADGLVVELSDDRRPARGAELSRRHARRRHRVGQRPAAGRRNEQFQRPDGRRVPRPGRGQPAWPPATSTGTTSATRPIWPAIWARSRTGRASARWRATAAWARSAAARTIPPSSAPSRTTSANTPSARSSSRR